MDIQQGDGKALPLQGLQGVEDGVVLKGGGDDVPLALPGAQVGGGEEGLGVGLAAAGGKGDLPELAAQAGGDPGPGLGQGLRRRWPSLWRLEGLP